MKAPALVSCFLLLTLAISLLSIVVQATEYREVNTEVRAEDILKHMENGEDIFLNNCSIIGELNIDNAKLGTVPNPYFYKLMKEGKDKEILIDDGLSENLSVIKSNITIENSIFNKNVNFSNVQFKNSTAFYNTDFNGFAVFIISQF